MGVVELSSERAGRPYLPGSYEEKSLTSLSPDGHFFAATELANHEKNNSVVVWDTATGKTLFVVPGAATERTALVELAGDRLILGFASSGAVRIWSVTQGREERGLELSEKGLEDKNTAITHNGLYVACVADRNRIVVLKVDTGATVARMRPPKKMDRAAPDLPPGMVRVDRGGWVVDDNGESANANDCTFIYAWLQALEFSPDSRELAGVSTHPNTRVICWDYKGKRVFDEPLYSERRAFWENSLTWFPGKKAWLIEHDIFERESGKVVLSVQEPFAEDLNIHVLDDDHLLAFLRRRHQRHHRPQQHDRESGSAVAGSQLPLLHPGIRGAARTARDPGIGRLWRKCSVYCAVSPPDSQRRSTVRSRVMIAVLATHFPRTL